MNKQAFCTCTLTSCSKKPDRSRLEDIPINSNALIIDGDFGLFSTSDGYAKGINPKSHQ